MSWQPVIKLTLLTFSFSLLIACEAKKQYQDTSALEKPPQLEVVQTAPRPEIKENVDTGLGDAVSLVAGTEILLKQDFEKAWNTIEKAIEFNEVSITDKNREEGQFYIQYDPDEYKSKGEDALLGQAAFFLFQDQYYEQAYLVTVTKHEKGVLIKAKLNEVSHPDLLDDGDMPKFDDDKKQDGARRLLRHLYGTLRNDLPLD